MERMKRPSNIESLTLRDVVLYVAIFIAIAWSFQLVPSEWLERITAEVSSNALRTLGFSSTWSLHEGEAYLTLIGGVRDVSVTIIRECTGIHVFAIFTGLVLPLRGGLWLRKPLSLITAGLLFFIMNISRVMLTVLLTAFDVPPFAWIFTNPTVETYHYPLSFIYGLFGVAILVVIISRWILPELGDTLIGIPSAIKNGLEY